MKIKKNINRNNKGKEIEDLKNKNEQLKLNNDELKNKIEKIKKESQKEIKRKIK